MYVIITIHTQNTMNKDTLQTLVVNWHPLLLIYFIKHFILNITIKLVVLI